MSQASVRDWILLGINLRQYGSIMDAQPYREAVDAFTQALNLDPRSAYAFADRGAAEHDLGNDNGALNDYQRAAQLGLTAAAQSYQQLKQQIAAQIAAQKAEDAKPHCYFPMLVAAEQAHVAAAG
jgi:tetratricopeptide (TPR) repeat protein